MDFISSISFPNEPLISWTFLQHFFIKIRFSLSNVLITGESNFDEKNVKEMFNWPEVHSEKKYYLWNRDFSQFTNCSGTRLVNFHSTLSTTNLIERNCNMYYIDNLKQNLHLLELKKMLYEHFILESYSN